jgi:hypothetical protein
MNVGSFGGVRRDEDVNFLKRIASAQLRDVLLGLVCGDLGGDEGELVVILSGGRPVILRVWLKVRRGGIGIVTDRFLYISPVFCTSGLVGLVLGELP